jgi:hypothetical protein
VGGLARSGAPAVIERLPLTVTLILYQRNDFSLAIEVTEPTGEPADLTGADVLAQIRTSPSSASVAGEFAPEIDEGGLIVVHLTAAVSAALPARCVYDVTMTDAAGQVTTLIAGTITIQPGVSRP